MGLRGSKKANDAPARKPRVTPSSAKRAIGVAKLVTPVVAPLALQAAAATRDRWDRLRAQRLGIDVDRLPEFTGKGAALHVRVSGLATSVGELRARHPEESAYAETTERRLTDLAGAVRAAEQMPAGRRRDAHRSVSTELDTLERDLLTRLGLPAS
ncbi:MAG: hypothetical protein GEV09_16340 [Pseudonocardiaceae bacterium]|nr:hypothetical protein [Pseudonocardiaceae bacterium]